MRKCKSFLFFPENPTFCSPKLLAVFRPSRCQSKFFTSKELLGRWILHIDTCNGKLGGQTKQRKNGKSSGSAWYSYLVSLEATVRLSSVSVSINNFVSLHDDSITFFSAFLWEYDTPKLPKCLYMYDASLHYNYFFPELSAAFFIKVSVEKFWALIGFEMKNIMFFFALSKNLVVR